MQLSTSGCDPDGRRAGTNKEEGVDHWPKMETTEGNQSGGLST